jgi:hypothetical protein
MKYRYSFGVWLSRSIYFFSIIFCVLTPRTANALSNEQLNVFSLGLGAYDVDVCSADSNSPGTASGDLQNGMWATGTIYTGKNGAYAANLASQPASFAELKGANGDNGKQNSNKDGVWGTGLGKLAAHTKIMIAYKDKYVIAEKLDIGDGIYTHDKMNESAFVGSNMPAHTSTDIPRLVDLYLPTTGKMLGVTGTVPVYIKLVDQSTPATPNNGTAQTFTGDGTANADTSTTSTATVCGSTFNADASDATLISLIKQYAWPTPNHKPTGEQTVAYHAAIAKAKAAGKYIGGSGGNDCGGFITRLMQDSGRDPKYGGGGDTSVQMRYLKNHPEMYKKVSFSDVKFGDIGIFDGHTFMYIGDAVPGFKYPIVEAAYRGGSASSAPRNINSVAYNNGHGAVYYRYIGGGNNAL